MTAPAPARLPLAVYAAAQNRKPGENEPPGDSADRTAGPAGPPVLTRDPADSACGAREFVWFRMFRAIYTDPCGVGCSLVVEPSALHSWRWSSVTESCAGVGTAPSLLKTSKAWVHF